MLGCYLTGIDAWLEEHLFFEFVVRCDDQKGGVGVGGGGRCFSSEAVSDEMACQQSTKSWVGRVLFTGLGTIVYLPPEDLLLLF